MKEVQTTEHCDTVTGKRMVHHSPHDLESHEVTPVLERPASAVSSGNQLVQPREVVAFHPYYLAEANLSNVQVFDRCPHGVM